MSIEQKVAKVLGVAVLVSGAFVSNEANAGTYLSAGSHREVGLGADGDTALCSASDSNSPTGRQLAILRPSPRDPSICVRIKLGGVADTAIPDCWKVARVAAFGCVEVIDAN